MREMVRYLKSDRGMLSLRYDREWTLKPEVRGDAAPRYEELRSAIPFERKETFLPIAIGEVAAWMAPRTLVVFMFEE